MSIMSAPVATPLTRREQMMQVVARVAGEHGVTVADIMSRSRKANLVLARYDAIASVERQFPGISSVMLGRLFGRDHTTILHALGRRPGRRWGICAKASLAQEAGL